MQLILGLTLFLWAISANFIKKHFNVLIILLVNSYFLGFVDKDSFGILDKFDLNAFCLIIYLFMIAANFSWKRLSESNFAGSFVVLMIIYLYAVLVPYFRGDSTLFWSLKEGKEYIHYLGFFAVYLSVRTKKDLDRSWQYIVWLSFYYVVIEFFYPLGLYKCRFLHYLHRVDVNMGFVKVYQPIFSIIFLTLFYYLWRVVFGRSNQYVQVVLLFLAGLFTAFRSYILGSFVATGVCFLVVLRGKELIKVAMIYGFVVLFAVLAISITFSDSIFDRFSTIADTYIVSGVREFVQHKGGSLEGRRSVNRFRWKFFHERPWSGYGFIDKKSSLGKSVYQKYGAELTMIDTGYLDVLIKFGIIGMLIFYGVFMRICLQLIKLVGKYGYVIDIKISGVALLCFLVTVLCSQVTHAGFTYSFAIIPISVALALFDSNLSLLGENDDD